MKEKAQSIIDAQFATLMLKTVSEYLSKQSALLDRINSEDVTGVDAGIRIGLANAKFYIDGIIEAVEYIYVNKNEEVPA